MHHQPRLICLTSCSIDEEYEIYYYCKIFILIIVIEYIHNIDFLLN